MRQRGIQVLMFFVLLGSSSLSISQNIEYDSLSYSRDDAFFGYTVYDVFLNQSGDMYLHSLGEIATEFKNGRKTLFGQLKRAKLDSINLSTILSLVDKIDWASTREEYKVSWSDKTTSILRLFKEGVCVRSVRDYGMEGTKPLVDLYNALDDLISVEDAYSWDSESMDIQLIDNEKTDSVTLVQHSKYQGSYNGGDIVKEVTLKGEKLKNFVNESRTYCKKNPYKNPDYEILPSRMEKFSLYIYKKDGTEEWVKYNGKRFRKKTYLDFITKTNVFKSYF